MKICFATHNAHKLSEVRRILGSDFEIVGLDDLGCNEEIPETGATLEENSLIKAKYVSETYKVDCFADDSGLEVEVLDGAPGVYSARFAGEPSDSDANNALLLSKLEGIDDRKAQFRTVITLIQGTDVKQFEGAATGQITKENKGHKGFGYDPIFVPDGHEITFAEMTADEKNAISHRGKAMAKLVSFLKS